MWKLRIIIGTIIACVSAAAPQASAAEAATRPLSPGEEVIQVNVSALLNARAVTTLTDGKLVTWTMGIDGGGHGSGYLTMAAALHVGNKNPKALPDNSLFPASGLRPEMLLHYSNDDGVKNQTRAVENGEFTIPVPERKYRVMFLAWTGAGGVTNLKFELNYAQGAPEARKISLPDYYFDVPANDPNFSYVVRDLAKWGPQNQMTETSHHNIHAVNVAPDPTRELTSIKVIKSGKTYLVFWGATGVTVGSQGADAPATKPAEASATTADYQGKPYGGVIQKIPGVIQAEAYDVAPGNVNGVTFNYENKSQRPKKTEWRTTEDSIGVSAFGTGHVTVTGEPLGEDNVYMGWTHSGEWWKTTVQVTEAGTYLIGGRFAAAGKGTKVELEFTPQFKTMIEVPTTAGRQPGEVYHVWKTSENLGQITLPAGTYVMKTTIVLAAGVNLDYFTFTKKAAE